jgi:hypothetical protein
MNRSYFIASIFFIFLLSLFIFQQINLTTADLGRHIINGKVLVNAESFNISRDTLLHTNFFSYTHADFPFVNHHWGSGILLYFIFSIFGFAGLSLFYGGLIILASLILFNLWRNKLPLFISFPIMLFLVPLIAERTEIRPEGISYLFLAIIVSFLYRYTRDELKKKWLWFIPAISLLFVNTHIYFIFVPFIIGMFLLKTLIRKDFLKSKTLAIILGVTILAICINPYGFYGVIYPFIVFKNYGYLVAENQSIPFLIRYGIENPNFLWWFISTGLLILTSIFTIYKHPRKFPIALFGIAITFAVLSFLGIRHLTLYGLMLIPIFSNYAYILYNQTLEPKKLETHITASIFISLFIFISILINFNSVLPWKTNWGVGLMPEVNASADFFKKENIQGPIFSNYDIGGYLIFHLYPKEKVFIDNRPEGYPVSFFKDEYVPMQEDNSVWESELTKRDFNAIYFYRHDLTPWAQKFMIARISDPAWAPVFVDNYTIIFLQRNEQNAELIKKYELPKNLFSVQ